MLSLSLLTSCSKPGYSINDWWWGCNDPGYADDSPNVPFAMVQDSKGNLYVAGMSSSAHWMVRKFSQNGANSTWSTVDDFYIGTQKQFVKGLEMVGDLGMNQPKSNHRMIER